MYSLLVRLAVIFMTVSAQANTVIINGTVEVDAQFLYLLTCTSDEGIQTLLEQRAIQTTDQAAFLNYRTLVRAQLMDPEWLPQSNFDREDYCSLASAILFVQQDCAGVSTTRLKDLQRSCN